MSVKSSDNPSVSRRFLRVVQAVLWVAICFIGAQVIVATVAYFTAGSAGKMVSANVLLLLLQLAACIVMAVSLLWAPMLWGETPSRTHLGISRSLKWSDIGWGLVGMVAAYAGSILLAIAAQLFMTGINLDEPQNLGLSALNPGIEMALGVLVLVVVGPFIEEIVFRGYLYGRLQALHVRFWLRTLIVSALFALAHWQWNVALDVFALSVIMCILREKTDSLWPSIIMHMVKNGVAFYFMFVNPLTTGIM